MAPATAERWYNCNVHEAVSPRLLLRFFPRRMGHVALRLFKRLTSALHANHHLCNFSEASMVLFAVT